MNTYAYFMVNHHLDFLLEQAAKQQRIDELFPQPTLRARIASAFTRLHRFLGGPVDLNGPVLPTLEHYPYRG